MAEFRREDKMRYVVVGTAICFSVLTVLLLTNGCHSMLNRMSQCGYARAYPLPHGGTAPPNGEPYSGMFFKTYGVNPFIDTDEDHLSTFAVDVDTASYTVTRRYLTDGHLPPKEAVRIEEFINYFKYFYEPPKEDAFAIYIEGAPSKFGKKGIHKLLKISIKGREIEAKDRKDAVLTFVIDVSGSMGIENRLGLVKKSLRLLVDRMRDGDHIGIVVYGTNARIITKPLPMEYRAALLAAIEELNPEGSTNAEEGLLFGCRMARKFFRKGCINRIVLCSDGVANNGVTDAGGILRKVGEYTRGGIYLSTIGFGMGNYNDVLMEKLADRGNGNYAYVDTLDEAKRVFVENLTGMLQVIAKDVKVQVDFNPKVVRSYRLLGYENRDVADDDFRDDKVDGGEVGAGHSVTALYELKLHKGAEGKIGTAHIRYKNPDSGDISEVKKAIDSSTFSAEFEKASENFRLAAVVAEFAEILKESYWAKGSDLSQVLALAKSVAREFDNRKDILEFVKLVANAKEMRNLKLADKGDELIGEEKE
jgi:Ca-activated chloride channel family protein